MTRIGILLMSGALLAASQGVASAATPSFENCESAYNYGENTAHLYVSAALNRASCDAGALEHNEIVLTRSLRKQKIQPQNTEAMKVCFYEGLYEGYVSTLWGEYNDCNRAVTLASVARAAVTVFTAMDAALDDVDDSEVNSVFGWVFDTSGSDTAACASYIRSELPDPQDGLERLVGAVCFNH